MTSPAELSRITEWAEVLDDSTYYELLGVLPIADALAIREAFRDFALAFHPDVHPDASSELRLSLQRIFQRGAEAYRVLSDSDLRLYYDMGLDKGVLRLDKSRVPKRPSLAPGPARPLAEICRSAGGRASAKKASRLIDEGDLAGAKTELERALAFEGGQSAELSERIAALEIAVFAMGDP